MHPETLCSPACAAAYMAYSPKGRFMLADQSRRSRTQAKRKRPPSVTGNRTVKRCQFPRMKAPRKDCQNKHKQTHTHTHTQTQTNTETRTPTATLTPTRGGACARRPLHPQKLNCSLEVLLNFPVSVLQVQAAGAQWIQWCCASNCACVLDDLCLFTVLGLRFGCGV